MPLKTSNSLRYATTLVAGNNFDAISSRSNWQCTASWCYTHK